MRNRGTRKPRAPRLRPSRPESLIWPVGLPKLRAIEALVLDCDGVLTPGDLVYHEGGARQLSFNSRDGVGLVHLCGHGVKVAILSGRPIDIAERRHRELGVRWFRQAADKSAALVDLCREMGVSPENTAYMGDDIPDLPAFRVAGLKIAVADAVAELRARADWITEGRGGHGAVREVCEVLLKAKGAWSQLIQQLAIGSD